VTALQTAFLRGREHHRVGGLELIGEGPAAVALSRGGARKTYSHTDPNEDCVAFALGPGGQLTIAADGHHGHLGSEAAVGAILEDFAGPWTAAEPPARSESQWRDQAFEALLRANRAVLETAARHGLPPAPTTFVLALTRPGEDLLLHLSVGDSHLFAVDRETAVELGGRDPEWKFTPFLGYEAASRDLLERYARVGQRGLEALRAIVLATDGLSEPGIGVTDPAATVHGAVSRVELDAPRNRRAVDTCRGVVEVAMASHRRRRAGDNVACSVVWLEERHGGA
jgi:serine/threonine protein phosphatase PrpC